jgi:hypothetical protein
MRVGEARAIARRWVREEASALPGFAGAYLAGSANWLPPDARFPATSDLDINVVLAGSGRPPNRWKLLREGVLLEVTPLPLDCLQPPERVLGDYHLAPGLCTPSIIADPAGLLGDVQREVEQGYARRAWVLRRCEHAEREVLEGLAPPGPDATLPDQVLASLFSAAKTAHVLLVAGLRNPTVRRRYAAVRDLLMQEGYESFYETLLALLGCEGMRREQVERHLAGMEDAFDLAAQVISSPFPFAADISVLSRVTAVDGSRELIEAGLHREAVFWIAVTYSRCLKVFSADAPEMQERFEPGYLRLLDDLGIVSPDDRAARSEEIRQGLGRVRQVAERLIDANPEIEG